MSKTKDHAGKARNGSSVAATKKRQSKHNRNHASVLSDQGELGPERRPQEELRRCKFSIDLTPSPRGTPGVLTLSLSLSLVDHLTAPPDEYPRSLISDAGSSSATPRPATGTPARRPQSGSTAASPETTGSTRSSSEPSPSSSSGSPRPSSCTRGSPCSGASEFSFPRPPPS